MQDPKPTSLQQPWTGLEHSQISHHLLKYLARSSPPGPLRVWIDGNVIRPVGKCGAKSITLLLSVGIQQLLHEGHHSIHLPTNIGLKFARERFHWVTNVLPRAAKRLDDTTS